MGLIILTLSRGFNFADGPFRNIFRISRVGLVQIFSQISRIDDNFEFKKLLTVDML